MEFGVNFGVKGRVSVMAMVNVEAVEVGVLVQDLWGMLGSQWIYGTK